jgi:hypothetical protein
MSRKSEIFKGSRKSKRSKKKLKKPRKFGVKDKNAPTYNHMCTNFHNVNLNDLNDLNSVLRTCSKKNIVAETYLARGGFGVVYKGTAKVDGKIKPVAIKFIQNVNLDEMYDEIDFSYYMGEVNIGPKMYDSFFFKIDYTDMNDKDGDVSIISTKKINKPKYDKGIVQVLIMEVLDQSAYDALTDPNLSIESKQDVVSQMIEILRLLIFNFGLHCIDIKPQNFVHRKRDNMVKIIDFGADFCTVRYKNDFKEDGKTLYIIYIIILLQLFFIIKIFIDGGHSTDEILKPFYNDPIFQKRNSPTAVNHIANYLAREKGNLTLSVFDHYTYGIVRDDPKYKLTNSMTYNDVAYNLTRIIDIVNNVDRKFKIRKRGREYESSDFVKTPSFTKRRNIPNTLIKNFENLNFPNTLIKNFENLRIN